MGVTLKDIAKELNLSLTTISFVLSGIGTEKGISKKTQEKILQYASDKKYEPNLLARSLHSGISNTIGVIVPSIGDMFYAELVREIETEAKKYGYIIIICSSERDPKQEVDMIRMLKAKQVDGLIIAPTEHCENEIQSLLQEDFPFVLIDRFYPGLKTNYVVIDDKEVSFTLVNHMINHGKKKIALITTDTHITAIDLRTEGYKKALCEGKLPYDPNLYREVERNDYANNIITVLDDLLRKEPDVDAFYFSTHYLASETLIYFFKRNIQTDQFDFACIHENPVLRTFSPKMNKAIIPIENMGREAVNILCNSMKKDEKIEKIGKIIPALMEIE